MIESQPGLEVCGDAVNGRETITKTAELKPDLVILDFAMPQLNGLNAASAIKTLLPNVPIIMFTMYSSVVMQEAEKSGITRLIDKAKSNDLVPAVEELLGTQTLESREWNPQQHVPLSPSRVEAAPKTDRNVPAMRKAPAKLERRTAPPAHTRGTEENC